MYNFQPGILFSINWNIFNKIQIYFTKPTNIFCKEYKYFQLVIDILESAYIFNVIGILTLSAPHKENSDQFLSQKPEKCII